MGKQRKASKAKGEKHNDKEQQLDTIISLLDLCGFYDDTSCPRMVLIDSLQALQVLYSRYAWWDERLSMTEVISQEFLRLEELIAQVRNRILIFEAEAVDADLVVCKELQQSTVPASWKYTIESLFSSYQTQRLKETMALQNVIAALDRIYSPPNATSIDATIESTLHCLQRYEILHRIDFQQVVSVCNESHTNNLHVELAYEQYSPSNQLQSGTVSAYVHPGVMSAATVLDAVRTLVHSANDATTSFFTTLLVIGPEGSGKTHLCDQVMLMANEASSSCQGK